MLLASIPILFFYLQSGAIGQDLAGYLFDAQLSFFFSLFVLAFLARKGKGPGEIVSDLGLSRDKISIKLLGVGILLFAIFLLLDLMAGLLGSITGVQINTNVDKIFGSAPLWVYIFISFIGPINEEILFRAFLVPRIGIIISALVFGILHAGYGSTFGVDMIAAFGFALVAGYVFKKTKSLYPSILAHMLVNLIAVLAILAI
ncbi:MAG: CPBP family intramembrane metalloprotease [Candidatus Micrarchaeota archaeon]|nr:CPBP family intramembrane metalloprotease [Candidatus Micrarchaeota archaeon]